MHTPRARMTLGFAAYWLAACGTPSHALNVAQDASSQVEDGAPEAPLDGGSALDAVPAPEALVPTFECDAGPSAVSSDAVFFRAKHACEHAMPEFFGKCGRFQLSFDAKGRASALTSDDTSGPLPDGYAVCVLNELADEAYECLAGMTIDPYESCTLL